MERIILVKPDKEWKEKVMDYKREFEENGEILCGTSNLGSYSNYDEWLKRIQDNSSEDTVQEGLVPESLYLGVRIEDNRIVGVIDIRHRLNEYLYNCGGHIGYSVRKSERRKGYAKEMLGLALYKCRELGILNVLITCSRDNTASAMTIKSQGGIMENEVLDEEDGRVTQRYWISL